VKKMSIKIAEDEQSSVWGFIGWNRLASQVFPESGELRQNEQIVEFQVDESGIHFSVKKKGVKK
jgi:hypothetical protein